MADSYSRADISCVECGGPLYVLKEEVTKIEALNLDNQDIFEELGELKTNKKVLCGCGCEWDLSTTCGANDFWKYAEDYFNKGY